MLRLGLLAATLVAISDQISKWAIRDLVMDPPRIIPLTGFFNIVEVWNRGISFGLFGSDSSWGPILLSVLALGICGVLIVWLRRAETRLLAVAIGLVVGGAIGNVIDRALWRAVYDFLDFHMAGYHWPAFNVADSAITIGVGLILVEGFIAKPRAPE
jgi:signal peptidase II